MVFMPVLFGLALALRRFLLSLHREFVTIGRSGRLRTLRRLHGKRRKMPVEAIRTASRTHGRMARANQRFECTAAIKAGEVKERHATLVIGYLSFVICY